MMICFGRFRQATRTKAVTVSDGDKDKNAFDEDDTECSINMPVLCHSSGRIQTLES